MALSMAVPCLVIRSMLTMLCGLLIMSYRYQKMVAHYGIFP